MDLQYTVTFRRHSEPHWMAQHTETASELTGVGESPSLAIDNLMTHSISDANMIIREIGGPIL